MELLVIAGGPRRGPGRAARTGRRESLTIEVNVRNAAPASVAARIGFTVAPAAGGETLARCDRWPSDLPPGDTPIKAQRHV